MSDTETLTSPAEVYPAHTAIDVDAVFAIAEDAMAKSMSVMTAGGDIQDCIGDLGLFFRAQGEIMIAVIQEQSDRAHDKSKKKKTSEEEFISLMRSKKLNQLETELKELLIYTGNGPIYEEMCKRRSLVVEEFHKDRIEELKEIQHQKVVEAHRRERRIQDIKDGFTLVIGGVVIAGLLYGIWWMFHYAISGPTPG